MTMMVLKRSRAWIALEFKPRDCWIGVLWQKRPTRYVAAALGKECIMDLHVWLCLLPCLPIHLIVGSRYADWRQEASVVVAGHVDLPPNRCTGGLK